MVEGGGVGRRGTVEEEWRRREEVSRGGDVGGLEEGREWVMAGGVGTRKDEWGGRKRVSRGRRS